MLGPPWRHEGALTAGALADRVRWQLDGWLSGSASSRPRPGFGRLTLVPVEVVAARGRQLGFWGGETLVDERIGRAVARVQGLLGADGGHRARVPRRPGPGRAGGARPGGGRRPHRGPSGRPARAASPSPGPGGCRRRRRPRCSPSPSRSRWSTSGGARCRCRVGLGAVRAAGRLAGSGRPPVAHRRLDRAVAGRRAVVGPGPPPAPGPLPGGRPPGDGPPPGRRVRALVAGGHLRLTGPRCG